MANPSFPPFPQPPPGAPRRRASSVAEIKAMLAMGPPFPVEGSVELRPSDVVVATFPKCGTTWMQQIVHGLRTRGSMDFEEISLVVPWIEMAPLLGIDPNGPQVAEPRAFKTHLSWDKVPKGGRYIYVLRDPADALVSFYHFMNGAMFERDALDLDGFAEAIFFNEKTPFDTWWRHVRGWWEQRERPDVMLVSFEELKSNLEPVVRRVASFAGIPAEEERIALATRQATFEFMRAREPQFDDHPIRAIFAQMSGGSPTDPMPPKVRAGRVGEASSALSPKVRAMLDEAWKTEIEKPLGIRSYAQLRERLPRRP